MVLCKRHKVKREMKIKKMYLKQEKPNKIRNATEEDIINYVCKYGRCVSPVKGLYGVSYNGRAYLMPDTRDLVVAICNDNNIPFEA